MRLQPWDPDLQTLISRIKCGDINLQPDFQRGEVWGVPKKRRLIDTVLRDWHIPPVHVVVDAETSQLEVLDGQQRLAAIRDFALGKLTVDGSCQPEDPEISSLDGLRYEELPIPYRRKFDMYTLRVIRISDFAPDEPGELFFRLNQPTNLTAAEQRNAYYGPARAQVKEIVANFASFGVTPAVLGFRNSRMAYDDIVAKVCYAHHARTLRRKITSGVVTAMYRSEEKFHNDAVHRVREALRLFGGVACNATKVKYNKATLFSWLVFLSRVQNMAGETDVSMLRHFVYEFESERHTLREQRKGDTDDPRQSLFGVPLRAQSALLATFNDRASSRVADVTSVVSRDLILWLFYISLGQEGLPCEFNAPSLREKDSLAKLWKTLTQTSELTAVVLEPALESWGSRL